MRTPSGNVADDGPAGAISWSTVTVQLIAGPRPIADGDLDHLAAAVELAQPAIAGRTRWRGAT